MGNLTEHARKEMKHWIESDDPMSKCMADNILEIVAVFSKQGHSGFSAGIAINAISKILKFEPLRGLTGKDEEWNEVSDDVFQNNRCPNVFKENDVAYQHDYYIFQDKDGSQYTGKGSRKTITFPYSPKHVVIKKRWLHNIKQFLRIS